MDLPILGSFSVFLVFIFQNAQLCTSIIHGQSVENSLEFPSVVSIQQSHQGSKSSSIFCTGVIVNNISVVTAAHCFDDPARDGITFVVAGQHTRSSIENTRVLRYVKSSEKHPQYDKMGDNGRLFDIAILKLEQPLIFTETIQPALFDNAKRFLPDNLTIAGWGSTAGEITRYPNFLQKLVVKAVSLEICTKYYGMGNMDISDSDDSILCTSNFNTSASPCKGDSGAGAFHASKSHKYLRGILSFNSRCNPDSPIVFTAITNDIMEWIKITTGKIYLHKLAAENVNNHADRNSKSMNIFLYLSTITAHILYSALFSRNAQKIALIF